MNFVDISIIILLLIGALVGFKNGFIKQTVSLVGFIICVIIAFTLKNSLAGFLMSFLPFFNLTGFFAGVEIINVFIYESISFLIILSFLATILVIVIKISGVIEFVLKCTIILAIPSKILGAIIGVLEMYIVIFFGLFFSSMPFFQNQALDDSKYADVILNSTPILTAVADSTMTGVKSITDLKEEYENNPDKNEVSLKTLDIMLKNEIVTIDEIDTLISKNKIKINNVEEILSQYR